MDYKKDYYQVLEVTESASKEDIRAAYRRLAKLYHPDKNAGNDEAEEKFKLISEANEILSNDILKDEYDAYRAEQQRWEKEEAEKEAGKEEIKQANKKTYKKTNTVVTETRIYLKGEITVKYWADCEQQMAASYDAVLDYKINPTEAAIIIREENIFPLQDIPSDYLRAYKASDIFAMPIPQPIPCEVATASGKQYFSLTINDIRLKNIKLEGVTKHENKSYGTLKGEFYGYSPKLTYEEVEETVTECFGETGKTEQKQEDGFIFFRKQYYYPDCSTYWGGWVKIPKAETYKPAPKRTSLFTHSYNYTEPGCGIFAWILALLAILFLSPKFFIVCLLLIGLALLIHYGDTIFSSAGRLLSFVGGGLLLLFLITAVRSMSGLQNDNYVKKKTKAGIVKTIRTVRRSLHADSTSTSTDSLISHLLQWQDYAGKTYEGTLSISLAALQNANNVHRQMSNNFYRDMNEIYTTMLDYDSAALPYVYQTFDSIKVANNLDEVAFAQLLVSAIQSQPYYLVVDKSCNDNYSDDFTRNYLANCNTDCCIGNQLFGVRSPVEFLSDLKGDCDTRSLLLYQLLKHYNYNVALLASNHYKHAMIAVNFTEPVDHDGLSIMVADKKYFMWETTSPGLNYGNISPSYGDLSFWDISLINKKIQYETDSEHL